MAWRFEDSSLSTGGAPLARLNRVVDGADANVLAKIEGRAGKTIVAILIDSGERCVTSALFEGLFDAQGVAT